MVFQDRELRGIPIWLLKIYLREIGGQDGEENEIIGPGWRIHLAELDDFQIGALRVGQVRMILEAEPQVFETLNSALEKKLLRAGG